MITQPTVNQIKNQAYHVDLHWKIYTTHITIHAMMRFEKITLWDGSDDSWSFCVRLSKTDADEALGRWLEKLSQLKHDPEARILKSPLLSSLWTVTILMLLAWILMKQLEKKAQGTRINKNFAKWLRIGEDLVKKSLMKIDEFWWIWRESWLGSWELWLWFAILLQLELYTSA